ncbi:hypothetical protein HOC35_05745 [Candidatus Woesearchaeota archaeon]|jgi:hypothetical protein|nr:hypothetical protein [Candidatus Woesearchaeota archaeon]
MGLFSKKKKIDAPPRLDVPSPGEVDSSSSFGEPDIPPIPSIESNSRQEQTILDDVPLPTGPESEEEVNIPLPPEDMEEQQQPKEFNEDIPPSPPQELTQEPQLMQDSSPMFPSMPEEHDFNAQKEMGPLPFEHSYDNMPDEQELKETFMPVKPKIPNYDRLLEPNMPKPSRPTIFKQYFVSMTEYREIMENLSSINILTTNSIDITTRLTSIQEEKGARYDKYQHELELINNYFAKLDALIFN